MAEKSILWSAPTSGDGAAGYTQDEATRLFRHLIGDDTNIGILPGVGNELAASGSASPLSVATGSAFVYGFFYWNDSPRSVTVTSPVVGTTGHRLVVRANWSAKQVRIFDIANSDGVSAIPAAENNPGTLYDVTIATFTITTGGVITLTDARTFAHLATKVDASMIDADSVTDAALRNSSALSVIGRSANSTGDPADIAAGSDGHVLRRSGTTLGFGQIALGAIPDELITPAKLLNRTRSFVVFPHRASDPPSAYAANQIGINLNNGQATYVYGFFQVPRDFVSGMTVSPLVIAPSSGNMNWQHWIKYSQIGENYNTHSTDRALLVTAMTANLVTRVENMSLASAAVGDIVAMVFERFADVTYDTIEGTCHFLGWIVEYTADS